MLHTTQEELFTNAEEYALGGGPQSNEGNTSGEGGQTGGTTTSDDEHIRPGDESDMPDEDEMEHIR